MKFGMFGRNIQVKIMTTEDSLILQNAINDYLKSLQDGVVIDIQMTESDNVYTASIFYQV